MSKATKLPTFFPDTNLLTKTQIKNYVHNNGFSISKKIYEKLNLKIELILIEGLERTKENNRKTLMARDI